MTSDAKSSGGVPKRIADVQTAKLDLSVQELYLLSVIDGVLDASALAAHTGLHVSSVISMLSRLEAHGVIRWTIAPNVEATDRKAGSPRSSKAIKPDEDEVDLDADRRRQINEMLIRLDAESYYALFGLKGDAERSAIRAAYFKLSKLYHPDSMFGKRLGRYQSKMEKIFAHLSQGYEVLGKPESRAEYDRYLKVRANADAARVMLDSVDAELEGDAGSGNLGEAPATPPSEAPPSPKNPERRRQLAAKRIMRTMGRSLPPASPADLHSQREKAHKLAKAVMSSISSGSSVRSGIGKATQFLRAAKDAEDRGELPAAMNALRLAKALAPANADIEMEYKRVRGVVLEQLVGDYIMQARYEETLKMWHAAADSWAKVAEAKPEDAFTHRRVAVLLLESNTDTRRAHKYAKRAVELKPEDPDSHLVLAKVLLEQGLKRNAQRQLEEGLAVSPQHDGLKELLKEVKQAGPNQ